MFLFGQGYPQILRASPSNKQAHLDSVNVKMSL
jgi:hypothetical protein